MKCPWPINRLLMLRTRGLTGPFYQHAAQATCVKTVGNAHGAGGPLNALVVPISARTVDESTFRVWLNPCVDYQDDTTGIEYRINGGAWTEAAGVAQITDQILEIDIAPDVIAFGDVVEWSYIGGSDTLLDCGEGNDIGDRGIAVENLIPEPE